MYIYHQLLANKEYGLTNNGHVHILSNNNKGLC